MPIQLFNEFSDKLAESCGPIIPFISLDVEDDSLFLNDISFSELDKAISLPKDSSSGLDDIRSNHLQMLNIENRLSLLKEFNNILLTGYIASSRLPFSWLDITLKRKNNSPINLNFYTCIVLAFTFRIIFEDSEWYLESKYILSNFQFVFRLFRSA